MYNLLISLAASLSIMALVLLAGFPLISAVLPGLLVFPVVMFFLSRRTGQAIQAALEPLPEILQAGKIDEARALITSVRDEWSPWQPLVHGQLTAQLGMLTYMQMKFDEAQPLLEAAGGRDWTALVALGCIHYRRDRFDEAWAALESAAAASSKESMVYLVWATLLSRKGLRAEALAAVSKGLEALPENQNLRTLKNTIANKKRIDPQSFPQLWYQFWPEELAQLMNMRGRRGGPVMEGMPNVRMQAGPPQPRTRGKLARRR